MVEVVEVQMHKISRNPAGKLSMRCGRSSGSAVAYSIRFIQTTDEHVKVLNFPIKHLTLSGSG
uniref:Uncharacterized protein n=1 Tax=Arion vulgaris TaxID=1028688 RepID=A0A0B6XZV9_9EUPU